MIIYPAIDLRGGRVVRLRYGDPTQQTVHGEDPLAVAQAWKDAGAAWLHVINLDGALGEATLNLEILSEIVTLGLPIRFGGGLRTLNNAQRALEAGATRIILGTLAVKKPEITAEAVEQFGVEAVVVALDAKDGQVATHGWQQASQWTPVELGNIFARHGAKHALYTDISRDGDLTGVNVEATALLSKETGLSVIASGGAAGLDEIHALKATGAGIAGVVIGKALYTGAFTLEAALEAAQQ